MQGLQVAAPGNGTAFFAPMIRMILGEDSFIVREGLREILASHPVVEVVAA